METKPLLFGIIGFMLGGLLVSVAATTFEKPNDAMGNMTAALQEKAGDDYDKAFIDNMVRHHQDAVEMSRLSEERSRRPEIKKLSKEIITTQQHEIEQLLEWRKVWFGEASSDSMKH